MFFNILLLLVLSVGLTKSHAQNLVLNPSFESGAECDGSTERIDTVDAWSCVAGKPGYINTNCSLSKESKSFVQGMRLPPAAHQNVLSLLKMDTEGEFIQGELSRPLLKDEQYIVSMFARRPIQFCTRAIKEVGIILTEAGLAVSPNMRRIELPALKLMNNDQKTIDKQYEWQEISALYRAKGKEQFITIGNFAGLNENILKKTNEKQCSYIFIDYVCVKEFKEIDLIVFDPSSTLRKGQAMLVPEVVFEDGTDVLQETSSNSLLALAELLKENPQIKIEISSHCDNNLEATKGLKLTQARANKIAQLLVSKGAEQQQIVAKGKGSMNAIALNNNIKGRQKNNRIEIKFTAL
jgi:outer membrane protein OmpA-like peptidoglycan-associated protein